MAISPFVTRLLLSSANAPVAVPAKLAPMATAPPANALVLRSDLRFTEWFIRLFSLSISSLSFVLFEIGVAEELP
jgi:hypothetical protein